MTDPNVRRATMNHPCGLRTERNEPVPLKSVSVEVDVQGHVASVSSTLQYENQQSGPVEAIFTFPMDSNASVYRFLAHIGGTEIEGQLRERQEAQEQYDDALSSGQQAFLLEESTESSDIFQLRVGSLPPGESASISLAYVTELAVQADDALRFCLPIVLNPRYTPAGSKSVTSEVAGVSGDAVPYTLSLSVHIYSPSPIQSVQSNCVLTPLDFLCPDHTEAKVSLSPDHKFDRDVEILLYCSQPHQPTVILEGGQSTASPGSLMGDTVAMLSLYPEFPAALQSSLASCGEFIFLVDRSGSMSCSMNQSQTSQSRIESARDTLLLLLKSLPMGCYFNIYGFGSRYNSFFPASVEYTQTTMESALQKAKSMQADLGGTEILQPLQEIYSKPCLPSHPRQLFVFTDGEVGNTKAVIDLVKRHALSHRCFTFGIGEGASSALVNGMAKHGSGHPQFITGADRLQSKVIQSLQFALQPAVKDISLQWNLPAGVSTTNLSPPIKTLFQGQRALVYAQLTGQVDSCVTGSVSLLYALGEEVVKNDLSFSLKPKEDSSLLLHRLGARAAILAMEGDVQGDVDSGVKEKVVELSVRSGVSSSYTSFIAVNTESKQILKGPLRRRVIPVVFAAGGGCGRMACRKMSKLSAKSSMGFSSLKLGKSRSVVECDSISPPKEKKSGDPMLDLIGLQKADGSWDLHQSFTSILGKQKEEVAKAMPGKSPAVWATVLALLWLHGQKADFKDEWRFLAMKAISWIKAQSGVDVPKFVKAGNSFLGLQLEPQVLGL
ncbi:von Willebrand factor A domain-containing protein 5A-like isoform X2 [Megalops cyprinoides]|uniref:von Willebrand factor A domain-containing protein 5A-like isoform X2 n=1 Tax=Megalops cyprinoides TaxID=118141 RepID=UPI001863C146|nr:von Willebrand factor A domain-containing protein 5A-like isoform X2 [Megalops cyprinoides]